MNWKKIIGIIVALIIVALFVLKLKTNKKVAVDKVYQYDKEQVIYVQADTLQLEHINTDLTFSGTFQPNRETKISAELQGKINAIFVDAGSVVKKGQSLLKQDNLLLVEQLHIIETQIANITVENELQLQANQIILEGLRADVDRFTILAKADAIQGTQLEKALIQLKSAENQRKVILQQSGLKNAIAQKSQMLQQINKTIIKAPFNGVVTAKLSDEGAYAAPGVPLMQITDITTLKFSINVPENELSQFKLNQNYSITVDAYPDILLTGKTTLIGSKANIGSSFPIQFTVNNTSDLKIKSGMFGKVNLQNATQQKEIIISSSAIVGTENQTQVYLVKEGKANLHSIEVSKKIQNKVVVTSGLKEGDVIITNGFINLFDGANIIVK
jgi:RND family efflux transporter MFP subunit